MLERASFRITPRLTRLLGIVIVIAAIKLGVLLFMGLDLILPAPAARVASAPVSATTATAVASGVRQVIGGPTPALAQQAPAQPQQAPAQPGQQAPVQPATAAQGAQELRKRQDELDQREQALTSLQNDLNARVAKLKEMETNIKKMLDEAKGIKDQKLKHLIDVYSNMNAKQASKVLETLDNTIAVKILAGMRGRQAGDVLNNMAAQKAAELTEMLTKLQLPPTDNVGPNGPAGAGS